MNNKASECYLLFPYIRFFNAMPDETKADFYIGNTLVAAGIRFSSFTPYIKTQNTNMTYKVTRAGKKDEILGAISLEHKIGSVCCLCLTGTPDKCTLASFEEPCRRENMDYGHLRICNLSPADKNYDVFANGRKILGDIAFGEISRYMEIRPGNYELSFMKNEKKVLNCHASEFAKGRFNTVYLCGAENGYPGLTAVFTTDAASYNGFYL